MSKNGSAGNFSGVFLTNLTFKGSEKTSVNNFKIK